MRTFWLPLVASLLLVVFGSGGARAAFTDFERVPALEPNVAFWKRVYIEWGVDTIAFHDEQDLGTVYRVLAVPPRGEKDARGRTRPEVVRAAKEEIQTALRSLARKNPSTEDGLTGVEREVFLNLRSVPRDDKFRRIDGIRAQNGLRERFVQGWANSGMYQGFIEAEMKRNGLPPELIGVAFVESLFYVGARSKVGAAGVWQFMSYTGREYMHLNSVVDERYDPMLATEAAASYLRQAKKELGTWPLAVTSYNYGRGGMKQLVNAAGTRDFGKILEVSTAKRFGFAARNYYASFLAILDILKEKGTLLKGLPRKPAWAYDVIQLPFAAYSTQVAAAGVDTRTLDALNPAITTNARDGKLPFPQGFSLRVPQGAGTEVLAKLAALPEADKQRAARAVRTVHKATGKQTVADIARSHGLSAQVLAASLGADVKTKLPKGKAVSIPHTAVRFTPLPEVRGVVAPTLPPPAPLAPLLAAASTSTTPAAAEAAAVVSAPPAAPAALVGVVATATSPATPPATPPVSLARPATLPSGKVVLGPVSTSRIEEALPVVDVGAGVVLPMVDVVAGAPVRDAGWMALEEQGSLALPSS